MPRVLSRCSIFILEAKVAKVLTPKRLKKCLRGCDFWSQYFDINTSLRGEGLLGGHLWVEGTVWRKCYCWENIVNSEWLYGVLFENWRSLGFVALIAHIKILATSSVTPMGHSVCGKKVFLKKTVRVTTLIGHFDLCQLFILGRREIVIASKNKALLKRKIR